MTNHQISDDLIRKELSLILDFEEIRNSQVLSRFIAFVVEKKLSGEEDEIKEYTIAVKGLGKPRDYNPQLDASVRIHAGRLRKLLTEYYRETGRNDAVFIDIPKGTYVPVFLNKSNGHRNANSLPLAPQQDVHNLSTASEIFEFRRKPVLAILPFHNLNADYSNDYFITGLGDQLSTDMARFQSLSVISYFATSTYKAELKDLQELKEKIQLDYVLTGSVRFINETMKMNVQLILAETGEIMFTDTFTHLSMEKTFEIQDEFHEVINHITNIIADDNGVILNMSQSSGTNLNKAPSLPIAKPETPGVQDAIGKYFEYSRDYGAAKFLTAINSLEKAVQTEPHNALAQALLASLYEDQYIRATAEDKTLLDKAMKLAYSASELDPFCQHAQKALVWALLLARKKEKSFETIEKCIKLNPKAASVIATMALAYICQGDYTRGFKWLLESVHLTPSSPPGTKLSFALFYYHSKDYHQSLKWVERMAPLEVPFLKLLLLSLQGKISGEIKNDIDNDILDLRENARNIIDRTVFDEPLKNEILDGLQLAGLTVK